MMKKQDKFTSDSVVLRHKKVESLKKKLLETVSHLPKSESLKLIQEFEEYRQETEKLYKELELAKKQSEENAAKKYAELYDFAPSGYFTLSEEGEISMMNLHGATMLNKERSQIQNKRFDQFVTTDAKPIFNQFLTKIFSSNESKSCVLTVSTGDNSILYVLLKGIITNNGEHCLVSVVDVTENKLTGDALKESNLFMDSLLNAIPVPVFYKNKEGRYLGFNESFSRIYGRVSDEFIGKTVFDIAPRELAGIYHAKDMELLRQPGVQVYDSQMRDSDDVLHDVVYHKATFVNSGGDIQGLIGVVLDVTESKHTEELLFNERLLLRTLIDNIPDSIYSKNLNCCKTLANSADVQLMGASSEAEVLGKNDFDVYPKELAEKFLADDQLVLQSGKPVLNREEYVLNKDGTKRWLLSSKLPLLNKDGMVNGLVGIGRDITGIKQAQIALQESEELYRNLVEKLPDGVYKSTHDGKFVEVNPAMSKILGYDSKEELMDIDIKKQLYFEPSDREDVELREKLEKVGIYRMKKKDGSEIWVEDHGWLNFDENLNIMYHEGIMRDVTDRKQAENALEFEHYLLNTLMNNMPAHIYFKDRESKFIRINKSHAESFRLNDPRQVVGKTDFDFFTEEHAKLAYQDEQEIIRTGRPISKEEKATRPDQPDTWFSTIKMPLLDKDKNISGSFGISMDITERKLAEEALRNSEQRYRLLIETVNEGILVAQNGFLKFVNPMMQVITGFTHEELLTLPFINYVHPEDREIVINNHLKRLKGEQFLPRYQFRIVKNDESTRKIEMNGIIIEWEGQPATLNMLTDITERVLAEEEIRLKSEQLLKLNIQKDKFFSIIAHDLRGPFSGILGLTKIMAEGLAGMTLDEIQKIAIVIRNSASNLYTLLGNLLEWSSMQRGLTAFVPAAILLKPKIIENLVLPVEMANDKSIVVSYDIPEDLVIFADENMFGGIMRNLMTNAVKFTPREGRIHASAKPTAGNMVQISVKDSGIGMNQNMIENLFHLDINTSRKGTDGEASTGLGLMICKDFVENHGGKLWVDSKEGKGSTFHFTIPSNVDLEESAQSNTLITAERAVNPVKKLKILIAEDDETSELLLSIALKKLSTEILNASTGAEAVEICRNNPDTDLIMMDVKMPGMNGYEATRLIRQFNTNVVIIAQTAFGEINDFEIAKEAGCNDYISKPINLDSLKRLIVKHFKD